jgi:hypothetical protein
LTRWELWIDDGRTWAPFFATVEQLKEPDLLAALSSFDLIAPGDLDRYERLRRSAEGKAVQLPGLFDGGNDDVTLLALGFARGELGRLAVPYMRRES